MAARIIEIRGWSRPPNSARPAVTAHPSWVPPRPTAAPGDSAPVTARCAGVPGLDATGGQAPRAMPIANTPPEAAPLSKALGRICQALPMAPLEVHSRARPALLTPVTQPEMPAVGDSPPRSGPWLEELIPETEAGPDTDIGELRRSTDPGRPASEPGRRDRAVLLRLDSAGAGHVFSVAGDSIQIGRHPTTDLTVQDRGVSRIHARVYRHHDVFWIEDLGSRNGTYVQGRRVEHCVLEDGDWVQLGPRVSFRYTLVDAKQEAVLHRLYDSSTRDALTGAYNRQHFDERLRAEIAYALRHGTNVSLVLFDIDHFKQVNDTYGHLAGDAVLRHIAGTIEVRLRAEDVFARYGGEEFGVILRGIDVKGAARVGERIRSTVGSSLVFFEGAHIPVCVSAGCASLECSEERTAEALIGAADRRLYEAKRAGRNRVVASDPD
jgi:two-component system cell cycle response regulator